MRILLTAATAMELEHLPDLDTHVDQLVSGVGVPATVFSLTHTLMEREFDMVIQMGLAGSFDNGLNPGDAVLVKSDCFADLGLEEESVFRPLFSTELWQPSQLLNKNGLLVNSSGLFEQMNAPVVTGITVNTITDNVLRNAGFKKLFEAEVETMEGAALHWVCLKLGIPFMQIRGISNRVGDRNKLQWKIPEALEASACLLKDLLDNLEQKQGISA